MNSKTLGEYGIVQEIFKDQDRYFESFKAAPFHKLTKQQKSSAISKALFELIDSEDSKCFLFPAVMFFIERLHNEKIFPTYVFSTFELWLNEFSELSLEKNYEVRGKIAGKLVPREEYQSSFPTGMGKVYDGPHFVTAHSSPDLDTTVASFWGWLDAFAAKIGSSLHIWNVPGGSPACHIETSLLFHAPFGKNIFNYLARGKSILSVQAVDLVTKLGMVKKTTADATFIDHGKGYHAVIVVDHEGAYVGEWHLSDVESVRAVINLLNQCLRWYENHLHVKLVELFAKEDLVQSDLKRFTDLMLHMQIDQCEPAGEFTDAQKKLVEDYLVKVLGVSEGFDASFKEFAQNIRKSSLEDFQEFIDFFESFANSSLFDQEGRLKENRPQIFSNIARIIESLDKAIYKIRLYVERLGIALKVKSEVLGLSPNYVHYKADLEEIRAKIDSLQYISVVSSDSSGKLFPMGIIRASDLYKPILGTVSLRDFSNRDETKVPPYLEIISVVDHHKCQITTTAPPVVWICDTQSANTLMALLSFNLNDKYGSGGLSAVQIEAQIASLQGQLHTPTNKRLLNRLLQKHLSIKAGSFFFISPQREVLEYLHFIYAILDDTDLLTKVSSRDLECVASLLNRLKSILSAQETEVVSLDDLPRDGTFIQKASERIVQNPDMYSLYKSIYSAKENDIEINLSLASEGKSSTVFADTKEQNGCCRVGQTKLFAKNFAHYLQIASKIRHHWLESVKSLAKQKKEVDMYIHVVSTIAGADELYSGEKPAYEHMDEMWIWFSPFESGVEHLKTFLNAFKKIPQVSGNKIEIEFCGDNKLEFEKIFDENFIMTARRSSEETSLPIAIIRFLPGTLNSRKAYISPCLPKL